MSVKNCPLCGRVFNDGQLLEVCPSCSEKHESDFRLLREYLYDNPNNNIVEVSEATGVSIEKIRIYMRNERIIAINNRSTTLLECKKCGKPIDIGTYCDECSSEMEAASKKGTSVYAGDSHNKKGKMYTNYGGKSR